MGSDLFNDDMREIVESFIVETREILDRLDNDLLQLEKSPTDGPLIDEIFRAVHTVKGTSGFLGLTQINLLTHHFEEVLNALRRGKLEFHPRMMDVLFEAFDLMKVLMQQVEDEHLETIDLEPIIDRLGKIAASEDPALAEATNLERPESENVDPEETTQPVEGDAGNESVRDALLKRTRARTTDTIRVDVRRLDDLLNLVGELVLGRNRLAQLVDEVDAESTAGITRDLRETSGQIDAITTELQSAIMHTRMVQIGRVFNKFPRVVRDLAQEFNKRISLEIEGDETELDKSLIEEIGDPLVHLIRNAADHGIEHPSVRSEADKPQTGTIRLSAAHEGNHVVIRIQDDGGGMDPEVLKQRAFQRNIITEREAAEMGDLEALQLIFRPGFSTAEKTSKVSGRGVGMDVVKTNITRLNGTIGIESKVGVGTTFILKLPLTLAIIQSLLVQVADETFAIPLHSVVEVVHLSQHSVSTINGREVVRLRDQVLPLVRTGEILEVDQSEERPMRQRSAVIVAIAHHRLGFVVDDLIGQKEIVIKALGSYLRNAPGIAGSTILGDGRVIMIVDVGELVRMHGEQVRARTELPDHAA